MTTQVKERTANDETRVLYITLRPLWQRVAAEVCHVHEGHIGRVEVGGELGGMKGVPLRP